MMPCAPVGHATSRRAECSCGTVFTGADVEERRAAHIESGEGNVIDWLR